MNLQIVDVESEGHTCTELGTCLKTQVVRILLNTSNRYDTYDVREQRNRQKRKNSFSFPSSRM